MATAFCGVRAFKTQATLVRSAVVLLEVPLALLVLRRLGLFG